MANFGTQIKSLTGIDTSNSTIQGYINTWLTDGVKEIQNVLPPDKLEECTNVATLNGSSTTLNYYTATIGKIVSVNRNNGSGYYQVCRKVPVSHSTRVTDSSDIMNYATATDPVYWMNNNTLSVFPTPTTSGGEANVYYVYMPAVVYTDSNISHFLTEAEYLVVNYASIKSLQYLMNQKSNDLPSFTLPSIPESVSVPSFVYHDADVDDVINPELSLLLNNPPIYSPPDLVLDYADANTWLNNEEDSEMVSSRLSIISSQINKFNAEMTNSRNKYTEELEQYKESMTRAQQNLQSEINSNQLNLSKNQTLALQNATQNFQKDVQEYDASIKKHQSDLQVYTAEVTKEMQRFNAELQKHTTDYQWYQSQYTQLNNDYNKGLQLLTGGGSPQQPRGE